jgi:exodeoxyribonuclease V alpha subunit
MGLPLILLLFDSSFYKLVMQHYLLLSRNLIYTGLTRAKQLAIVAVSSKVIGLAVKKHEVEQWYTRS